MRVNPKSTGLLSEISPRNLDHQRRKLREWTVNARQFL